MVTLKVVPEYSITRPHVDWLSFASTYNVSSSAIWNGWSYGTERQSVKVTSNGTTALLNFIKSTNWFKSYWQGGGHRQVSDLINLIFLFTESRVVLFAVQTKFLELFTRRLNAQPPSSTYLYQNDEWALPGNLNRKFVSSLNVV